MKHLGKLLTAVAIALTLLTVSVYVVPAAVQGVMGLAVAQSSKQYNDVKDYAAGDGQTKGVLDAGCMLYNGTSADRCRGTILNGLLVDVSRLPTSGTAYYAINRTNLTTASVNLAFGFTSKKIAVQAALTNTADICVDWLGGTAVCPAANTAGDARMKPGTAMILDDYAISSLSFIADSGTQEITVQAWN